MGYKTWRDFTYLIITSFVIQCVTNMCIKEGNLHKNGSVWMEGTCTQCKCESPLAVCEPTICLHPGCDSTEDEIWLSGRGCCPTCSRRKRPCLHGNRTYMDLTKWKPTSCSSCSCADGRTTCRDIQCSDVICMPGDIKQVPEGGCCPVCKSVKRHCVFNNQEYADGAVWQEFDCVLCSCSDGIVKCFMRKCPAVICPKGSRLLTLPGDCCPKCVAPPCEDHGELHQVGSEWKRDKCTWCKCEQQGITCFRQTCPPCQQDKNALWKKDRCCPLCIDIGRRCISNGTLYDHTETWHVTDCDVCACHNGDVVCSKTVCSDMACSNNEILLKEDGECCAKCVPRMLCQENGITHEHGTRWQASNCEWCTCTKGIRECFALGCSQCPKGLVRTPVPGQCCGHCTPSQCSSQCAGCHRNDPSHCTTCTDKRLHLQDGSCSTQCSPGFFPHENKSCLACDPSCLTCEGPTKFHCITCHSGATWEAGSCTKSCSEAHVLHKGICQGCSPGCEQCTTTEVCDVCKKSYILQNGRCQSRCPRRGMWISSSQICKENRRSPVLRVQKPLNGEAGSSILVTSENLNVTDSDSPEESITYRLVHSPTNGHLICVRDGHSIVINRGKRFTQKELLSGKVLFQHDKEKPLKGFLRLQADDGRHGSSPMSLSTSFTTARPPLVTKRQPLLVTRGHKSAISASSNLGIEDEDSPGAVTISVIQGPFNGGLVRNDQSGAVSGFSLTDLQRERIVYVHYDNSSTSEDHIVLQVSDGTSTIITLLNILIIDVGRKTPILVRNQPLYIDDQGEMLITSDNLMVAHLTATSGDLIYSLRPPPNRSRQNGTILMVVAMTTKAPPPGWQVHNEGHMSAEMSRFRQSDIDAGRLWYRHTEIGSTFDILLFQVCHMASSAQCMDDFNIDVKIVPPQNDAIANNPGFVPSLVFLPDENNRLGTIAFDNEVKLLKATDLGTYIPDTQPEDVVYRVTSALSAGEGTLEHVGRPRVPVHLFTLDDLAKDLIVYRPPLDGIGEDEREVVFKFIVQDATTGSELPEQSFHINVIPVKTSPPVASESNPTVRLTQGSSASIGPGVVHVTDPDTPSADLVITVEKIPRAGVFLKMDGENRVILREGDQFDFGELVSGLLFYMHDGSDTLDDGFYISVTDGQHSVGINIEIEIMKVDRSAPKPDPGARMAITLSEGATEQITRSNMAFTDTDSEDDELVVVMVTEPRSGHLMLAGLSGGSGMVGRGTSFTQMDINDGYVSFKAQVEIGPHPQTENIYVNVTDTNGNVLAAQQFTITTTPVNNQVPVVTLTKALVVDEGGRIPLTLNDISVDDVDTSQVDLQVIIDTAPRHGAFENVRPAAGSEVQRSTRVVQFSMSDVINGNIHYVQSDHLHHEPRTDDVLLHVDDGINASPTLTLAIYIQPKNDEPPSIRVEPASCVEGGGVTITNDTLTVVDNDTQPMDIIFTIEKAPTKGSFRMRATAEEVPFSAHRLRTGDTFTYTDVLNGLIVYTHGGRSEGGTVDELSLRVTDAIYTDTATLLITITPQDDETPRVIINRGLRVPPGSGTVLTPLDLQATDLDTEDHLLMYTITRGPTLGTWLLTLPPGGPSGQGESPLNDEASENPIAGRNSEYDARIGTKHTKSRNKRQALNNQRSKQVRMSSSSLAERTHNDRTSQGRNVGEIHEEDIGSKQGFIDIIENQRIRAELRRENVDRFHFGGFDLGGANPRIDEPKGPISSGGPDSKGGKGMGRVRLPAHRVYPMGATENQHVEEEFGTPGLDSVGRVDFTDDLAELWAPGEHSLPLEGEPLSSAQLPGHWSSSAAAGGRRQVASQGGVRGAPRLPGSGEPTPIEISADGLVHGFRQLDINEGRVQFVHSPREPTGISLTDFSVSDPEGNVLLDQTFRVHIVDDRNPPRLINNKELVVGEGSEARVTTSVLSASDGQVEPESLRYSILQPPTHGHLALADHRDIPIVEFLQSDLAANRVIYVHTSSQESRTDRFTFSVSDGPNQVTRQFFIRITPVDNKLPTVINKGLRVQEGQTMVISEFSLQITDPDTQEESLQVLVTSQPEHGQLVIHQRGDRPSGSTFTMEDIYEGRVTYVHDGSDTKQDKFLFQVTDGSNSRFIVDGEGETERIQTFYIDIQAVDDGTPKLLKNKGLHFLTYDKSLATNVITENELLSEDGDTQAEDILYRITSLPSHGYISYINSTTPIRSFTQDDISNGLIRYVLSGNFSVLHDQFTFDVLDRQPNTLSGSEFHIQWTLIHFERAYYNTTETSGIVYIPVKRIGSTRQYSVITCKTVPDTATSASVGSKPGKRDFVPVSGQILFDGFEDTKMCKVAIQDDTIFEGPETFFVELSHPEFSLLGRPARAAVTVYDREDEPEMQFEFGEYAVNESAGIVRIPLIRTGDVDVMTSAMCHSQPITAQGSSPDMLDSGSDFQTRPHHHRSRVMFSVGAEKAFCEVRIIDDSLYEEDEQFELILSEPSMMTKLGEQRKTVVTIQGPNDIPSVHLSAPIYHVDESEGEVVVTVVRSGSDLSSPIDLWCCARPSTPISALPGEDFLPSPQQITFQPGQRTQPCTIAIVDDMSDMQLEGNETVEVYLYDVVGAVLDDPPASIIFINDTNEDVAVLQFEQESYIFDETSGTVSVPVIRTGDLSYETSVICFTRQRRARVMMDYVERPWTDASRIPFLPGQKVANCTITLVDDKDLESEEDFLLRLADPIGFEQCGVRIGELDRTTITIKDHQDVPLLEFEKPTYEVSEPPDEESVTTLEVVVLRRGDQSTLVEVRCSTRDGSAIAGMDYDAHSQIITFLPGMSQVKFDVDILHNPGSEWQEMFTIILGPATPSGAVLGELSTTTVIILDNQASGSTVFPAPPIVVSLLDYDDIGSTSLDLVSPGYPVVCVTPCDPKHPSYTITGPMCESSGINQSAVIYRWEISNPTSIPGPLGIHTSFGGISGHLPFARCDRKVLENVFFRPRDQIRCIIQPIDRNGRKGVPTTSDCVTVASDTGLCRPARHPNGVHGQTFVGNLEYIKPSSRHHPNTLHVSVKVPHHDGLIPLVSTIPIHNLQYLLTVPTYRQQHACSNFAPRSPTSVPGFMQIAIEPVYRGRGYDLPYQFNEDMRSSPTVDFYKHLNLRTCAWTFDAYFDMSDLVNLCRARVMTDFNVLDKARSRITVRVPLYVSYVYNAGLGEWSSIDHRTELDLSIMYDTMVWRAGLGAGLNINEDDLTGDLHIIKVATNPRGSLIIEFKTRPNFRGHYLITHPVHPDWSGAVVAPDSLPITLKLEEVWSQSTFDSPEQHWSATSDLSLQDYSGDYHILLIPCTVRPLERFPHNGQVTTVCTPHSPKRFDVALTFQQTLRPLPAVYALATDFHITSNINEFLLGPKQTLHLNGFDGVFNKGDKLYGRVLWSPSQDLKNAYQLQIEKVFVCTGTEGYVPTYDPSGEKYNSGPQYGCLHPSARLDHRYMVLDRGDPAYETKAIAGHGFNAEFASDNAEYRALWDMPGIDGFTMNLEPLYRVKAGNIWYLQVLYVIRPSRRNRQKRSQHDKDMLPQEYSPHAQTSQNQSHSSEIHKTNHQIRRNGTNILILRLSNPSDGPLMEDNSASSSKTSAESASHTSNTSKTTITALSVLIVLLCFLFLAGTSFYLRRTIRKRRSGESTEPMNLEVSVTKESLKDNSGVKTSVIENPGINKPPNSGGTLPSSSTKNRIPRPVSV